MCGITGFSRADERSSISKPGAFLKSAVLAIENRGTDATGFAYTDGDRKGWYWKTAKPAHDAVFSGFFPTRRDIVTAIGHTRWATQGSRHKNENNHPVIDDGVMLVHNGIITNDKEIQKWLDPDHLPKAEVDTAAFAAMLAHPDELYASHVTDLLGMVAGSAAFAWIMTDSPETLHLARTLERPLTIGWTRLGDLVMSSTPMTLADLSDLSGVKIRRFREVEEGTYLRVVAGEIVEEQSFRPLRSYSYNTKVGVIAGSQTAGGGTGSRVGGGETKYYLSERSGTYTPVDDGVTAKREENRKFWERIQANEEFWERVWNGENLEDILDEIDDEDQLWDLITESYKTDPQVTVAARRKLVALDGGKKDKPYDQEKLVGKTEVDKDQREYEQYLADQDQIDWSEVVPRRGWGERKESAADDVSAALSREDR
jgi:hypothetical protein